MLSMEENVTRMIHRGKRLITNEWVYGYLLVRKDRCYIVTADALDFMDVSGGTGTVKLTEVDPNTVGVYTLKNDCRDIKIFTGDILETRGDSPVFSKQFRILVVFDDDNGMFYGDGADYVYMSLYRFCRIVGNMYDNPELLETVEFGGFSINDGSVDDEDDEEFEQMLAACDKLLSEAPEGEEAEGSERTSKRMAKETTKDPYAEDRKLFAQAITEAMTQKFERELAESKEREQTGGKKA